MRVPPIGNDPGIKGPGRGSSELLSGIDTIRRCALFGTKREQTFHFELQAEVLEEFEVLFFVMLGVF
jgi:hypothetical protein